MVKRAKGKQVILYFLILLLSLALLGRAVQADPSEIERERLKKTVAILLKMMETRSGQEKRIYATSILEAITQLYQVYNDKELLQFIPLLYQQDVKPLYDIGFTPDGSVKLMRAPVSVEDFQRPQFSQYIIFNLTVENQRDETVDLTGVSIYLMDIYGKKYSSLSSFPDEVRKAIIDAGKTPSDFFFGKVLPHATVGKFIMFPRPYASVQLLRLEDTKGEIRITVFFWDEIIKELGEE